MKNKFFGIRFLLILVIIYTVSVFIPSVPVQAQSTTTLSISPASATTYSCDPTVVTVKVADVVNLYGYDIIVTFTPGTLNVMEVTNAGFLDSGRYFRTTIDNANGVVRLVMTQVSPSTAKSGSGDLISIKFQALSAGSPVTLAISGDSILSNSSATSVPYTASSGTLTPSVQCPFTTQLSVLPTPDTPTCSIENTINVQVRYAVDLYSYDVSMTFDKNVIEVTDVNNGGFLEAGLFSDDPPYFNNALGTIHIAMSQADPAPAKTGTGNLITIKFKPKTVNLTGNITIDAANSWLVNSDISYVTYAANNAQIIAICNPTAVDLISFTAEGARKSILLNWETANEVNNMGFNLYRASSVDGVRTRLNSELIQTNVAPGGVLPGGSYSYTDATIKGNRTYYYWLEDVDNNGGTQLHGPVAAKATSR